MKRRAAEFSESLSLFRLSRSPPLSSRLPFLPPTAVVSSLSFPSFLFLSLGRAGSLLNKGILIKLKLNQSVKAIGTMSSEAPPKTRSPQIVTLNHAFKLAEQWVSRMSRSSDDEPVEAEQQGRPLKLGLGARAVPRSNLLSTNDPAARRLHNKLEAAKKRSAKVASETGGDESDDSDGELESRTGAFAKKRGLPPALPSQLNTKKKKQQKCLGRFICCKIFGLEKLAQVLQSCQTI
ncbi:unnamed protein product [Linum tenue]|uniref:Uncharacterized protein n=1 Tax=Linum tenue TaxID=586396 RepID=A0AAV0LZ23_9ROSI|nr:unnamed protein product [Linum tenue]